MKDADTAAAPSNHFALIESLAAKLDTSVMSVSDAYQHKFVQLEQETRTTQFIPLLTARWIGDRLRCQRDGRRWR